MTITVLLLIVVGASVLVFLPVWREVRRPWTLSQPVGDEEALRQEELAALESLRDLTLDFKLANLSERDYHVLAAPLQKRTRRARALQAEQSQLQYDHFSVSPDLDHMLEDLIRAARRTTDPSAIDDGTTAQIRYCQQCGTSVRPQDRFCAACGAPLWQDTNTTQASVASTMNGTPEKAAIDNRATKTTATPTASSVQPVAAPNRRRWLWWAAAAFTIIWITAVLGLYLNERNSQLAQTPIARFDGAVQTIAVGGQSLILGTDRGAQASGDGRNWTATDLDEPVLAATPLDETGTTWLAATTGGLWRSDDGGEKWQRLPETDLRLTALASVPSMGNLWGVTADALYGSQDGGNGWTLLSASLPGEVKALAVGQGLLFLGTNRGVFSSADGGQSWVNRNGFVNGRIVSLDIYTLAYDSQNDVLYAGTPAGLSFLNLDAPGGWGQRSLEGHVTALALGGDNSQVLWVGTADGRLLRSADRGVTWR